MHLGFKPKEMEMKNTIFNLKTMLVLQNLNKEIDLALEKALFIVWWCSTNVQ
jgi:hypothetical protein